MQARCNRRRGLPPPHQAFCLQTFLILSLNFRKLIVLAKELSPCIFRKVLNNDIIQLHWTSGMMIINRSNVEKLTS